MKKQFFCIADTETGGFNGPIRTANGYLIGASYYPLLQIAFILTDEQGNELCRYDRMIANSEEMLARIRPDTLAFHKKNGFWDIYCASNKVSVETAQKEILALLGSYGVVADYTYDNPVRINLIGKSIYFDRCFLDYKMPEFSMRLGHQMPDVSTIGPLLYIRKKKVRVLSSHESSHFAMDDCEAALACWRIYENLVDSIPDTDRFAAVALGIESPIK